MPRRLALMLCLCGGVWAGGSRPAHCQNDWQFPDPYFGAVEIDIARPPAPRTRRVESVPASPRTKSARQRSAPRFRPRWSAGYRQ